MNADSNTIVGEAINSPRHNFHTLLDNRYITELTDAWRFKINNTANEVKTSLGIAKKPYASHSSEQIKSRIGC